MVVSGASSWAMIHSRVVCKTCAAMSCASSLGDDEARASRTLADCIAWARLAVIIGAECAQLIGLMFDNELIDDRSEFAGHDLRKTV